jgi:acetyltransferase-like isoleucine patch superfamily enzyme
MIDNFLFYILFKFRFKFKKIGRKILAKRNSQRLLRAEGAQIGENCKLQSLFFPEPYLITLGNHVHIGTDVQLITHDGAVWVMRELLDDPSIDIFGSIKIGDNVFIGNRTLILPNVTIGDNVIIGAGAIVTKDIPSGQVAIGCPAKPIGTVKNYIQKHATHTLKTKLLSYEEKKKLF